jgi:Glycosyl transferase family 2
MGNEYAVVITDTGTPRQLLRCLREVATTVPPEVEIVVVAQQHPPLGRLARRVRRVQVRAGESLEEVTRAQVLPHRFTVVARSRCRWQPGWLDRLVDRMATAEATSGVLGSPAVCVEVYAWPGALGAAAPIDLGAVPGIELPMTRDDGSTSPVTISASLIVKDEEASIERCLAAVTPLVDEVVVYDTGSTDRTVEVAEAAGARVITGYWDDDFGAARNRALEHCTSGWILPVDADEIVHSDREALHQFLSRAQGEVARVALVNVTWDGGETGDEYVVERLFRRVSGQWHGALHERIVSRRAGRSLKVAPSTAPVRLLHLGYTYDRVSTKAKGQRNVEIARAHVEAGAASASDWCNYGRSLALAGKPEEALAALNEMLGKPAPNGTFVLGGRTALECLHDLSHTEAEAERWLEALTEHGEAPGRIALERARLALRQGEVARAADLLTGLSTDSDCWGIPFNPDKAVDVRAEILYRQGRAMESFSLLLSTAGRTLETVPLAMLLLAALRAGIPFQDLAQQVSEEFIVRSLREVLHLDADNAHAWLDALWSVRADPRVLLAADLVSRGLGIDRVLVWQMRCLESGTELSPLKRIATDAGAGLASRCLAHAVLGDVLLDQASRAEAIRLVAQLPQDERAALLSMFEQYAPTLVAQAREAVDSSLASTVTSH